MSQVSSRKFKKGQEASKESAERDKGTLQHDKSLQELEQEKDNRILEALKENKPLNKIAAAEHVNIKRILEVKRKHLLAKEEQEEPLASKAFKRFEQGKNAVQVVIELGCTPSEAGGLFKEYSEMKGLSVVPRGSLGGLFAKLRRLGFQVASLEQAHEALETIDQMLSSYEHPWGYCR